MSQAVLVLYRTFLALLSGVPLLVTSLVLLEVWINPATALGGDWLKAAASLIFLEFLLLHSGAFMAVGPVLSERRWIRLCWFLGFCMIYGLAMFGYAYWTENSYVLWLVATVLLSRLLTLVILRDKAGTMMMMQRSAVGVVLLLLTAVICFIPIPPLGITEAIRYETFGPVEDMLSRYPQRSLAWGMVYFLLMGLVELYAGWILPDVKEKDIEKAWDAFKNGDSGH